jgi:CheY-like chemotaxis protein
MSDGGEFRILIADDSVILRQRLIGLIQSYMADVRFSEAGDTVTTVRKVQEDRPAVIILDLRMPGGGGLPALRAIKQLTPAPIVIVLTNYPFPQYQETCLAMGAEYFLDKSTAFSLVPDILQKIRSGTSSSPLQCSPADAPVKEGTI